MCEALRRQAGRDLAIIILVLALTLGAVTAHSGKQTVRAQDAATPVAVIPAETPVAPVEPTPPPAPDPSPTAEMATSTPEPSPTVSPPDDVSVAADVELSLQVETPRVAFGQVSASGDRDPAIPHVTSEPDDHGAYYVNPSAIRVTVTGDGPWSGLCAATENQGTATDIRVADHRLEWRPAGTGTWTPLAVADALVCFTGNGGTQTYLFDLRLRVESTDSTGTFSTVLTFHVVP